MQFKSHQSFQHLCGVSKGGINIPILPTVRCRLRTEVTLLKTHSKSVAQVILGLSLQMLYDM